MGSPLLTGVSPGRRKIVSTLSWRENVKEQLFQRTQEEDTEGEKTSGADEEEEWVARRGDRTSVSEHAAGVVPGAGEQENDPSKAPCFSPTHRLAEPHNLDRGT